MDKKTSKLIHMAAFTLIVVGGLNWGLFGLFKLNLVEAILGFSAALVAIVYVLVGLSALYLILTHKGDCKICSEVMAKGSKAS